MSYTTIIPSRNPKNLAACIGALRANGETGRILIVWDGEPVSASLVVGFHPCEFLAGEKPFCFARNVNLGIEESGTDDVVLMNDDALLQAGGAPCGNMDCREYGIVSAAIAGYPNPLEPVPWMGDAAPIRPVKLRSIPFVAVYIPRHVIDRVGLLEERFEGVYGGEDDDYCYRVRAAGFRLGVFDGCVVDHATLPSTFRPYGKGRSTAEARQRFYEIHGFVMGTR